MTKQEIPNIIIGRLPIYLRALQHLSQNGQSITSSQELGERLGLSAAQIRKDLSQFGEFGKQGTGYDITYLTEQLQRILKLDRVWDMAIVGAGDVGHALAYYQGVKIGMVAVPADVAQLVTDQLVEAGVKAILNYAPIQLSVAEGVHVENIDPATHLQKMSYYL
jgi:redox-sensing transcriptional repressor